MKKPISKIKLGIGIAIAVIGVIALIIANICTHYFFSENGFQVFGKFVRADYQEKCYFWDDEGNSVGEGTFTIVGMLYDEHKSIFSETHSNSGFTGHMEVDVYPFKLEDGYGAHSGAIYKDYIIFSSHKINDGDFSLYYWVFVMRSNPEVVVIHIITENDETITGVCGNSKEKALENYKEFREEYND